jgi:hypothetical protein
MSKWKSLYGWYFTDSQLSVVETGARNLRGAVTCVEFAERFHLSIDDICEKTSPSRRYVCSREKYHGEMHVAHLRR